MFSNFQSFSGYDNSMNFLDWLFAELWYLEKVSDAQNLQLLQYKYLPPNWLLPSLLNEV